MNPTLRLTAVVLAFAAALPPVGQDAVAQDRAFVEEPVEVQVLSTARSLLGEITGHSGVGLLRESLWEEDDTARYGLHLDENWQEAAAAAPERPLVVLIHGLNSSAERNAPVMIPIRAAGYPAAVFAYPNDWDLTESATFLSKQLKEFAAANPQVNIAIVTHSMGGLVARACVEDASLDPGNVTRLVMIAPPSQGSLVAHVGFAADIWEHGIARTEGSAWRRLRDSVVDGLGEASTDLIPGSPFLTRLNARERNPKIRYAIFLGTHAAVNQTELGLVRRLIAASARSEGLGAYAQSADTLVAEMDEVVEGKGDGVVAVKRGRLPGVDDVVELPFDHLTCTGEPGDDETILKLQSELVARLK
jgi:pimeloyl-ACP methyl ester carboxylesterase